MIKPLSKTKRGLLATVAGLLLCLASSAFADEIPFPKTDQFVNDYAGVLSQDDIRTLTEICQNLQTIQGYHMVIVTEPTLNGEDINHAGTRYMNELGVGRKGADTGVAIMLAMQERQVDISIGSGTKAVLTDAAAGRICRDRIRPLLREGKTGEAMIAGAQAVDSIIRAGGEGTSMPLSDDSGNRHGATFPVGLFAGLGGMGLIAVLASRAAHKCPRCGHWMSVSNQMIEPPGFLSNGYGIRTRTCASCGFTDQNRYTIYRNTGGGGWSSGGGGGFSSGGGGGWSGGGSGGGGFSGGGGSCDGGGASCSW